MAKLRIFVSATIVLILISSMESWANPLPDVPDSPSTETAPPGPPPADEMAISPAPQPVTPPPPDPEYYPYSQQLTFRAGRSGKFPVKGVDSFDDSVTGFQYLFPRFLSPKLEAGADLHEEGRGHIHAGLRWIHNERLYFRPSYKVSVDHLVESKDGLATFTHLENYFVRGSGTLEYVLWSPYSIRLEPEILVGIKKPVVVVTLGVSRGW